MFPSAMPCTNRKLKIMGSAGNKEEERAQGGWVFYFMELPQRGSPSSDKNSFLAKSISSITNALPNYSPFVHIETKIRI